MLYTDVMIDNSFKEQEQPKNLEVKKLGQWFHPFDESEAPVKQQHADIIESYIFVEDLDDVLARIPIRIYTHINNSEIRNVFAPFDPDLGYQVTEEDFQLESRIAKYNSQKDRGYIDREKVPLRLGVDFATFKNKNSREEILDDMKVKEQFRPYLKRILLQISFPGTPPEIKMTDPGWRPAAIFESPIYLSTAALNLGSIRFAEYYPIDTGPLASPDPNRENPVAPSIGLGLQLPQDPEKLKQIRVRFVLQPEASDYEKRLEDDPNTNTDSFRPQNPNAVKNSVPKAFYDAFEKDN